ncbi:cytochrome P450 2F5 [Sorex fumeus]|uniref:cytochrome P450 2F5 n=1 Tax=Sorex fumeus TaxID=62283 RepID=UPI0024AD3B94|nr:cytochrome P450 2F5 [Sorex fumeus]XP_055992936.1 cytochrome P450 2F5 [Sorex fumeus]XP_055992937.1 cytochrome P450 2F5 [Sorex fumeus]XP_055992938.1 cytochrome P450 2F5 [Sorex fumeus]XP_055992939.1 cytochrome P450 2F5 [Sorex fumeus]
MDSVSTAILLLLLAFICLFLRMGRDKGKLPPGPRPLPLLGNLLQLRSQDMLSSLTKLSKEYGSVYTVHLGPRRVVVLSGYQTVKEALVDQGEEFSGRGDYPVFYNFTKGNGIAFSNGDRWKALRRFSVQILRNFGMGKRSIEERILEEGSFLLEELRKTNGEPFDPTFVLSRSVSNIICSVLFGSRFEYHDERLLTIIRLINDNFQIMSSPWGEFYNIFPSLLDWVPGPHRRLFQNYGCMKDLIARIVREHQASLDPNCPRDFIDCFLNKMAQEKQDPLSHFYMDTLLMTTHNLLFGGTETVGTTLRHTFLVLMKYPKVQARVHEEIDRVVGRARLPTVEDRVSMPYTDAVIHEVQRFADVIPMNLPHRVIRDTNFRGFVLPKGTDVITLLNTVHYDPSQFVTPREFNPEHFLDDNKSFKKSPAFMPFSAGRRLCLGESLARMELFLYLTAILQNFTLQPLGAPEDIDLTPLSSGLGNLPRPFQLSVRAR